MKLDMDLVSSHSDVLNFEYLGAAFVALNADSKTPISSGWQHRPNYWESLEDHLRSGGNIGLLLGRPTDLIDIDCDCEAAAFIAGAILPEPFARFSRRQDSAHFIYRCSGGDFATNRYSGPSGNIIEFRGQGSQTMIPPSVHPDGDQLEWSHCNPDAVYQNADELRCLVKLIASAVIASEFWEEGVRHNLALAYSGLLRKAGFSRQEVENVIGAICDYSGDPERNDRIRAVTTTFERPIEEISGAKALNELIGADAAIAIESIVARRTEITIPDLEEGYLERISRIEITDASVGEAFSMYSRSTIRYIVEERAFYHFEDHLWRRDDSQNILRRFRDFIRAAKQDTHGENRSSLCKYENLPKANNAIEFSKFDLHLSASEMDANPYLIGCQNGIYDLKGDFFRAGNPEDNVSQRVAASYDSDAKCPAFQNFLTDICEGDLEMMSYLQRIVGYSLLGENPEQRMFIFHGYGANGKSTLVNVVRGLFGDYGRTAPMSILVQSQGRSIGDDLLHIGKARFIAAAETEHGEALAEAKIKQITGGEPVAGRPLYGSFQEIQINGTICLSSNNLPRITGTDEGIRRRISVIEFTNSFPVDQQDRTLKDRLKAEYPGILNWALEGYRDWKTNGLNEPDCVLEATKAYFRENDSVGRFVEECCVLEVGGRTPIADMNLTFSQWCEAQGTKAVNSRQFNDYFRHRLSLEQRRTGRTRFWEGISLQKDPEGRSHKSNMRN